MENDIKERLRSRMKERKIKVPTLSQLLDIPKDRIYAWYRDNTNPKGQDWTKIENWLNEKSEEKNEENSIVPYWKQRQQLKTEEKEYYFPVYAGNTQLRERYDITIYSDSAEQEIPIGFLPTSLFPGADHGEKAFGNSMYPRVVNQGLVIGKIVNKDRIVFGELYGIHYDGNPPIVKYVKKSSVRGL